MAAPVDSLFDAARDLYVVPIRHHSPACAAHLLAMMAEVRPAHVLIEGPCDFDSLIPLVTDAATRPPVAIVSVEERATQAGEKARRAVSYFPLCAHSPEYVALRAAMAAGIPASFIDLPMGEMAQHDETETWVLPNDEQRFDSSDYVKALARQLGCRDGNEVWDHLFETQLHGSDWRRFFHEVATYCGHIRACTDTERMAADGTLEREAQMRGLIARARKAGTGPIVAVVGGFHAGALLADGKSKDAVKGGGKRGRAYLVRYGHRQLNALTGYGAGLPLPGYYDGLWQRRTDEPGLYADYAADLITGFARHLRTHLPGFAPSLPVVTAALENAHRLAELRGRPGPMRDDILDACRSTLLKGEDSGDAAPVMAELAAWLTGSALGDVPPSAGSPPLVEAVRTRARSLGFHLDDGERRSRDLDIYRKDRHREASRFLHGMVFLGTGFGQRTGGPDFRSGVDLDRLHEHWTVNWSPLVEARLIELAADGDTLEAAVAVEVGRRLDRLRSEGQGHNARAAILLFVTACQAGLADGAAAIVPFIADEVTHDPDLASVAEALRDLVQLGRNGATVGLEDSSAVVSLTGTAWRRALFLLPNLRDCGEERISTALDALVTLREVVEQEGGPEVGPFEDAVADLLAAELDPTLAGAVAAIACLSGRIDAEALAARLSGELNGAYVEPKACVGYLRGIIAVSRELLWAVPALIAAVDLALDSLDGDGFVTLLPHLRLAFSRLDPRDIDRLARLVASDKGGDAAQLTRRFSVTEAELTRNLALDRRIADRLAEAGLLDGAPA